MKGPNVLRISSREREVGGAPRQVSLLVGGQVVDTQPLRVWTDAVVRQVWMPLFGNLVDHC